MPSGVVEDEILRKRYALMCDKTTHCNVEQLVLQCRHIFNGYLKVKYLSMIDLLGSLGARLCDERVVAPNATNIARTVEDFPTKGLPYERLCGIGTDGAPVTRGKKGEQRNC